MEKSFFFLFFFLLIIRFTYISNDVVTQITGRDLMSVRCRTIRRRDCNVPWKCSHAFTLLLGVQRDPAAAHHCSPVLEWPGLTIPAVSYFIQFWMLLLKREPEKSCSQLRFQESWGINRKTLCWSQLCQGHKAGGLPGLNVGNTHLTSEWVKVSKLFPTRW